MGLLDMLNDDTGLLGLNLLAAAGPQARPMSFGQRLLGGMNSYKAELTAAEERKQKKAMQELQMGLLKAQIGETNAQGQQRLADIEKKKALEGLLGGVLGRQAAPSQYGVGGGGISLGGVQEAMTPRQDGLAGASIDDIAKLKALGGIDLLEQWKTSQTGQKLDAGNYYVKNGKREFLADPTKGISFDGRNASLIPGALESQSALAGAIKSAEARANANLDLVPGLNPDGASGFLGTRASIADSFNGAAPTTQRRQAFDPLAMAQAEAISSRQPVQYDIGGQRGTFSPGGGLRTGLGPADIWKADEKRGLMVNGLGETKPMTGQDGRPIGSPDEASSAKRDNQWLSTASRARSMLSSSPTESVTGTVYDKAASFVGHAPKGAKEADALRGIGGWLQSNVPRFEGPQSNRDTDIYEVMAGKVGDSTIPAERRLFALGEIERLIEENTKRNPAWRPDKAKDGAPGSFGKPAAGGAWESEKEARYQAWKRGQK